VGKILLLVVIALVVYTLIKRYKQSQQAPAATLRPAEDMVKCAHCHVNLPRSDALAIQGEFFCTSEHQQLGKK
jgi:uncharacterized protein